MSCRAAVFFFSVLSGWCLAGGELHLAAEYFGSLHTSPCLVLQYSKHADVSNDFYVSVTPGNFPQVLRIAALLGKKFTHHGTRRFHDAWSFFDVPSAWSSFEMFFSPINTIGSRDPRHCRVSLIFSASKGAINGVNLLGLDESWREIIFFVVTSHR